MHNTFSVKGKLVDSRKKEIYPVEIFVEDKKIKAIQLLSVDSDGNLPYLLPGFIDSHVHIESSMLVPSQFAKLAVVHGTVGTISDPHEIANVCGIPGVEYMINDAQKVNFKFNFGAPSCVPATVFETAGATINAEEIAKLLKRDDIKYLSEMMNFPGVLYGEEEVMKKINAAHQLHKPVDGHAPGLRGADAKKYIEVLNSPLGGSGATDHECFTREEALDKLSYGMKIIIREGSAAKNFEALIDLLNDYPEMIMFCSDDKHPDSLVEGHINQLCQRAVAKGIDIFNVIQAACINPVEHYKLDVGLLRENDFADFILVEDLIHFNVLQTFINGEMVAANGISNISTDPSPLINNFNCSKKEEKDFEILYNGEKEIPVIEALDGQLFTNKIFDSPKIYDGKIISNAADDILKIVVINRYQNAPVAIAFIKNFGLRTGAIASSVAHDSHNIVAVGVDDKSLCKAVNLVIESEGGVSCVSNAEEMILALPVGGLMNNEDGYKVAKDYTTIDNMVKEKLGSKLSAPFMTLSFMALLVIPHLKLSDKGLFDGDSFGFL